MSGPMINVEKKILRSYKIRPDIYKELQGMVALLNRDTADGKVTETFVVESALVYFMKRFKGKVLES